MKLRSILIALLAFIGMVDALYLSIKRNAGPIPCHVTRGCTDVLTSKYSEIAGVPLSWIGLERWRLIKDVRVYSASTGKIQLWLPSGRDGSGDR